jgi:hypothetical protein
MLSGWFIASKDDEAITSSQSVDGSQLELMTEGSFLINNGYSVLMCDMRAYA